MRFQPRRVGREDSEGESDCDRRRRLWGAFGAAVLGVETEKGLDGRHVVGRAEARELGYARQPAHSVERRN